MFQRIGLITVVVYKNYWTFDTISTFCVIKQPKGSINLLKLSARWRLTTRVSFNCLESTLGRVVSEVLIHSLPYGPCMNGEISIIVSFVCIKCHIYLQVSRYSAVGISTSYGMDGPGIESWCERDFPHPSTSALVQPSLLYNGCQVSLPGVERPDHGIEQPLLSSTSALTLGLMASFLFGYWLVCCLSLTYKTDVTSVCLSVSPHISCLKQVNRFFF